MDKHSVGWADVATKSDLAAVELSLRGEMAMVRGEMAMLRAEVRSQVPKFIAWNFGSLVMLSSLILGAAQLLR